LKSPIVGVRSAFCIHHSSFPLMPRLPKPSPPFDVLIWGNHPSAYLAGALLRHTGKLRVALVSAKECGADRLVTINTRLFELHPLLGSLAKRLDLLPVYGLHFLSDLVQANSAHRAKSPMVHIARWSAVQEEMMNLASGHGVELIESDGLSVERVDEKGVRLSAGGRNIDAVALMIADELPLAPKKLLGIPDSWGPDVVHRMTVARIRGTKLLNLPARPLMPMSLDLCGRLCWGWLLPGEGEFQLAVEEPIEKTNGRSGTDLLSHWARVLHLHQVLKAPVKIEEISTIDLPLAGALAHEGVANRTLLIGPAGGFFSACGEEIFPCCWSAIYAVEVMKKALKERHLQDALQPYRQKWRTTLGDYLRGPHQNLRFLLPLVYRNPAMTARLAEAILLSKSVVR
jgi:hypothetical protein